MWFNPFGDLRVELFFGSLAGWTRPLLSLAAVATILIGARARARQAIGVAGAGMLLIAGIAIRAYGFSDRYLGYPLIPLIAIGASATLLVRGKRAVLAASLTTAALVGGIFVASTVPYELDARTHSALAGMAVLGGGALVALVLYHLWRLLADGLSRVGDGRAPWPVLHAGFAYVLALSIAYSVGWISGQAIESRRIGEWALASVAFTLVYLPLPLVLATTVAVATRILVVRWEERGPARLAMAAVGVVWGAVASPGILTVWGMSVPVGLVALAVLIPLVSRSPALGVQAFESVDASELADQVTSRRLLEHGPAGTVRGNVRAADTTGATIALVPLAFFVWEALDALVGRTESPLGAVFLLGSIAEEIARWLVTAGVFALLYDRIPGWNGPVKAGVLSSIFFLSALSVELLSRWAGEPGSRLWTFPASQVLLFLLVLSVLYDGATMRAAGGNWADLRTAYGLERTRRQFAVAGPLVLAVLAVAQQLVSGTGFDFVRSVIENAPKVVSLGG